MNCYSIIKTTDINELVEIMNEVIETGWEPLGGVGISGQNFIQAVINRPLLEQKVTMGQSENYNFQKLDLKNKHKQ